MKMGAMVQLRPKEQTHGYRSNVGACKHRGNNKLKERHEHIQCIKIKIDKKTK